jgi:ArsR family metal-binding transcriptional regulator
VGGVLTAEEPFIARHRLEQIQERDDEMGIKDETPADYTYDEIMEMIIGGEFALTEPVEPRPIYRLGTDMAETIRVMEEIEATLEELPDLDCGACGCPSCRAMAEDVVTGETQIYDCIFKLRERLAELTGEMKELSASVLPTMKNKNNEGNSTEKDSGQ